MEQEQLSEQGTVKKGRQRKKQLYSSILQLMEFYFSDANLNKDRFLSQLLENDPYVDINVFLKFNKIRRLTCSVEDVTKALKKSTLLKLSDDQDKVSRVNPPSVKTDIDKCTVYVENIKADTTHDWLINLFSDFGKVDYVSIPKYKHNKVNKGFAFVEFATEDEANKALEYFAGIGSKMSSKISPDNLQSIATFEGDGNVETSDTNLEIVSKDTHTSEMKVDDTSEQIDDKEVTDKDPEIDTKSSKRKLDDSIERLKKKAKTVSEAKVDAKKEDNAENISNAVDTEVANDSNTEICDTDKKKKVKSKKSKKKAIIKELGLQVLPKQEWKKLRNQYLDMQKKKMKQLKMHLNRRKFSNKYVSRGKPMETPPTTVEPIEALEDEKLKFIPGVIVKFKPFDISADAKSIKAELKAQCTGIKYVDLPHEVGNTEIFVRFGDNDQAGKFITGNLTRVGEGGLLQGEEEQNYWSKIKDDRQYKLKKGQHKCRGREKLLKKAERELGKHIRFDEDE